MGATSCQSSTTLSYTIQTPLVLPGTSSTRSHFSSIARGSRQIGPHRVGPLPLCIGAQCPFITLIKCLKGLGVLQTVFVFVFWLMVTGQVMSPRHSDQMSLVPGSYLWVPGGYMSVKEGYKYAVVFPHVSLRGKMYFLRSERSKLTNCIMIKVCELVECRL